MKILDEFYYGNIEPFTRSASYWREIREVSELRERSKEKLLATLTDDQKERFQKYLDCVEELRSIDDRYAFLTGFRIGARMIAESFTGEP